MQPWVPCPDESVWIWVPEAIFALDLVHYNDVVKMCNND